MTALTHPYHVRRDRRTASDHAPSFGVRSKGLNKSKEWQAIVVEAAGFQWRVRADLFDLNGVLAACAFKQETVPSRRPG
jgi:hypothetical protein